MTRDTQNSNCPLLRRWAHAAQTLTILLSSSAWEPEAGGEDVPAVFGVQLLNMKAALAAQPAAFYLFIYTSNVKIRHSLLWNEAQQLFHPRRFPQFCSSKPQQAPC